MRDGRHVTVEVMAEGAGLVSHAGTALLAGRRRDRTPHAQLGMMRALALWRLIVPQAVLAGLSK